MQCDAGSREHCIDSSPRTPRPSASCAVTPAAWAASLLSSSGSEMAGPSGPNVYTSTVARNRPGPAMRARAMLKTSKRQRQSELGYNLYKARYAQSLKKYQSFNLSALAYEPFSIHARMTTNPERRKQSTADHAVSVIDITRYRPISAKRAAV